MGSSGLAQALRHIALELPYHLENLFAFLQEVVTMVIIPLATIMAAVVVSWKISDAILRIVSPPKAAESYKWVFALFWNMHKALFSHYYVVKRSARFIEKGRRPAYRATGRESAPKINKKRPDISPLTLSTCCAATLSAGLSRGMCENNRSRVEVVPRWPRINPVAIGCKGCRAEPWAHGESRINHNSAPRGHFNEVNEMNEKGNKKEASPKASRGCKNFACPLPLARRETWRL